MLSLESFAKKRYMNVCTLSISNAVYWMFYDRKQQKQTKRSWHVKTGGAVFRLFYLFDNIIFML